MVGENAASWLEGARRSLLELGLQPLALVALDRPTVVGHVWTDGTLQPNQVVDAIASRAAELEARGSVDVTRAFQTAGRPAAAQVLTLVAAPRGSPRAAALLRAPPGADLASALQILDSAAPRSEAIEMAAALGEATGAAVVVLEGGEVGFASRPAFVQHGVTGPFLGLACLSRAAPEALERLARAAVETSPDDPHVRRGRVGPYSLACFVRRIGENNLALAAARYSLTRAELTESESMIAGLSCKESASRLKISPETVRQRRKVIYRKLGVESCGTAVARILDLEMPPAEPSRDVAPGYPPVRPGAGPYRPGLGNGVRPRDL